MVIKRVTIAIFVVFMLVFLIRIATHEKLDVEAILALPLSPSYEVLIVGIGEQSDGTFAPYYEIVTLGSVYRAHGGTVLDIGDLRIVCPIEYRSFLNFSRGPNTNKVVIEANDRRDFGMPGNGSGGGGGSQDLRFYSYEKSGITSCEIQIGDEGARTPVHILKFEISNRDLTIGGQTFRIGNGHRVIFLDAENQVVRMEQINRVFAEIDMTPVTEFDGTLEAYEKIQNERSRGRRR